MPAGLSCAKRNDKEVLCACLALCFNGGIQLGGGSKVKDHQPRAKGASWDHSLHLASSSLPYTEFPSRLFQAPAWALLKLAGLEGQSRLLSGRAFVQIPVVSKALEKSRDWAPAVLRLPNWGQSSAAGPAWQAAVKESGS